jgi:hypothetical protein
LFFPPWLDVGAPCIDARAVCLRIDAQTGQHPGRLLETKLKSA